MKSTLTIGELAARFDLPTHVLRHWESEGLLSPARTASARRRYTEDDLYRVASILNAKQAGLSLPDIRQVLTAPDPATRKQILRHHHENLAARMTELRAAMSLLESGLACTHETLITCPNYRRRLEDLINVQAGRS